MSTLRMTALSLQEVRKLAPQAFAENPKPGVSKKYSFLPTSRIIEDMDRLGWKVTQAKSNKYRNGDNAQYGTHVIKFFHPDVYMRDQNGDVEAYINIVVMNNHTGLGSFKFEIGIFRLVCSNGLIIKDQDMGSFNIRHTGYTFEQLQETLNQVIERLPDVVGRINHMNQLIMSKEQQREFAEKAFALRTDRQLTAEELDELLAPRRKEDEAETLWSILNRVQESVLKGGFHITNAKGKERKVKGIRNIQKDVQLNQQIWELGMQYA